MDNTGGLVKIYVCPVSNISDSGQIIDQERLIQVNFILDSAKLLHRITPEQLRCDHIR